MTQILIAGFGGQGILFTGRVVAYAGMLSGLEVSWLPSYGPEMRGGTANCGVCLSGDPIGCPLVLQPDILMVMNTPSYNKFANTVPAGGKIFLDSSLVDEGYRGVREDIVIHRIPATQRAQDENLKGMAGILLLGKMLAGTSLLPLDAIKKALEKCIPSHRAHLLEPNLKALRLGMEL